MDYLKQKTKPLMLFFSLLLVVIFGVAFYQYRNSAPTTKTSFIMSTIIEYHFYGKNAQKAIDEIDLALKDMESKMSLYIENSEIDQLNQQAGIGYVALSKQTFELLGRCKEYGELSGGQFDVTIAPLSKAWGITSEHPRVPEEAEIQNLLSLVDYQDILLDEANQSAMLAKKGQSVDVGGIAKGYACSIAREIAQKHHITSGYLSVGGNMMVIGEKPSGKPFRFGVRDPLGMPNDYIAVVEIPGLTMATSGNYERYFEKNGIRYHHILDPRDGYPAENGLISVSVIAKDGAYADFMSTYLFVAGREFALQMRNQLDCELILIDRDLNVYVSDGIKENFSISDTSGRYRFEVSK